MKDLNTESNKILPREARGELNKHRAIPCIRSENSVLLRCQFAWKWTEGIPIKILADIFLVEIDELILKLLWKYKWLKVEKIVKEKSKSRELILSCFMSFYKAMDTKCSIIETNRWNKIEEIDPYICTCVYVCIVVIQSPSPTWCSMPGLPVLHHLLEFAQVHVYCIGDVI